MFIRSAADIRNSFRELADIAKETKEPVYITVNGRGEVAIIDIEVLNDLYRRLDMAQKVAAGYSQIDEGKIVTHAQTRERYKGKNV